MVDTITVSVGTEGLQITVIEAILHRSSTFFDNAMKPEWAASRSEHRVVDLTDEDPDIFKLYLHWLYFKTMPTVATKCLTNNNPEYVALAKCYVLGEKLMDNGFKNAVVDALLDAMNNQPFYPHHCPDHRPIKITYDGTLEGSPTTRLLVDIWTTEAAEH